MYFFVGIEEKMTRLPMKRRKYKSLIWTTLRLLFGAMSLFHMKEKYDRPFLRANFFFFFWWELRAHFEGFINRRRMMAMTGTHSMYLKSIMMSNVDGLIFKANYSIVI